MALRLYDHPLSPYGQKVKIALIEKGIEFQGMLPNAIGSGQVDSEFAAANPRQDPGLFMLPIGWDEGQN